MLRVALRRVFEQVESAKDIDNSTCCALSTLGTASTRLAALQGSGSVDVAAAFSQAQGEAVKEFGG